MGIDSFLLSDTVGFIRKLPHHLVESFKSTLDEVRESDILVHVVDLSHPQHEDQIHTVQNTLKDMEAADKTTLMVLNKLDRYRELNFDSYLEKDVKEEIEVGIKENYQNQFGHEVLLLSAQTKENLDDLREILYKMILEEYEKDFLFKPNPGNYVRKG